MSLFLKIFLWFWLAIALLIGVFSFVSWTTQNEPVVRQFRTLMSDSVNIQVQNAAQIYQNEGRAGLDEFLGRLKTSDRIAGVGVFDGKGVRIGGDALLPSQAKIYEQALHSENVEFDRSAEETTAAKRVKLRDSSDFVMITQIRRPVILATTDRNTWIVRILALILTGGLVCYGLARYLTSPIVRLQGATRDLANGELSTRLGEKAARGRDELSQLARDFDVMAERIESLVASEKRLTQDISHELRSPLARMNVALEIARQKANEASLPILERIDKESNRLNEMISRLLILSKLESGAPELEKQIVDLRKLVEDVVADAEFEARAKQKSVKVTAAESSRFSGSENLIRSAVENVLRNAIRYTDENTAVEVTLTNDGDNAVVVIEDHGGGVPDNELENLFRPFYRIGEARERKAGGVGLGLAIAQRAVFAHKGTISASNTADGLRVEIKLPRIAARQ